MHIYIGFLLRVDQRIQTSISNYVVPWRLGSSLQSRFSSTHARIIRISTDRINIKIVVECKQALSRLSGTLNVSSRCATVIGYAPSERRKTRQLEHEVKVTHDYCDCIQLLWSSCCKQWRSLLYVMSYLLLHISHIFYTKFYLDIRIFQCSLLIGAHITL